MLEQQADVGLSMEYRVLGQLSDVGMLLRHAFDSGIAVYELQRGHHHAHIICLECGRVDEFTDELIEQPQRGIVGLCARTAPACALRSLSEVSAARNRSIS